MRSRRAVPNCANSLTLSATAAEAVAGNSFSSNYVLASCQSRTGVSTTATDLGTGAVVWRSVPDLARTAAVWVLPYRLTTYRIDARALNATNNTVVATASTTIATLAALPCAPFVLETVTNGYYLSYGAIWSALAAQDCGMSGLRTRQIQLLGASFLTHPAQTGDRTPLLLTALTNMQ